jgi:hypothetical protein
VPQVNEHVVPSQPAAEAPAGIGQLMHEVVPHELTLVLSAHRPPQLCVPAAHWPEHAAAVSMQVPLQSFWVGTQTPPHCPCTHVGAPPVGAGQGLHEAPHVAVSVSLTQAPLQTW